ncbi:MAG: hypothetical protein MJ175_09380 [Clostridia bacterium]|nr:hypothetical protein [Clostridia bacterium]
MINQENLEKLAKGLAKQGIDISQVVALMEYLSEDENYRALEDADYTELSPEFINNVGPFLDLDSRMAIFDKILAGKEDWHLLKGLGISFTLVENAVIEGSLPTEVLVYLREE